MMFLQKLVHLNLGTVCTTATSLVRSLVGKKEKLSTYSYQLQQADESLIERHVDHILSRFTQEDNLESQVEDVDMGVPQTREEPTPFASELRSSTREHCPPDHYTPERF